MVKNPLDYLMPRRPEWNSLGPPLPAWFRVRLKRIDRNLEMQFIPPDTKDEGGVNAVMFPSGIWTICRRLRQTGWLFKRWTFALTDANGQYKPPSMDTLHVIALAKRMWKARQLERMEEMFDRAGHEIVNAHTDEKKKRSMEGMLSLCHKYAGRSTARVFFPKKERSSNGPVSEPVLHGGR
jgi:hypothetical protein